MQTESLPRTRLPPDRYALIVLTAKKKGSTLTMLSARGVKIDTIGELIAAGLAATSIERVVHKGEIVGRMKGDLVIVRRKTMRRRARVAAAGSGSRA
jgi:hypothetical protein